MSLGVNIKSYINLVEKTAKKGYKIDLKSIYKSVFKYNLLGKIINIICPIIPSLEIMNKYNYKDNDVIEKSILLEMNEDEKRIYKLAPTLKTAILLNINSKKTIEKYDIKNNENIASKIRLIDPTGKELLNDKKNEKINIKIPYVIKGKYNDKEYSITYDILSDYDLKIISTTGSVTNLSIIEQKMIVYSEIKKSIKNTYDGIENYKKSEEKFFNNYVEYLERISENEIIMSKENINMK